MEIKPTAETVEQFTEFYNSDLKRLIWALAKAGATPTEAEDFAQEAMLVLLANWPTVRSPRAFARTVAMRVLYRGWDDRKRSLDAEQRIASRERWLETFDANQDVDEVLELLDSLPAAQREVFALHTDGFSEKEIAEITGKKETTVRSTLRHARDKVKSALRPTTTGKEENHGP
ncbi:sigma-70 family RNA polymerase sigma factor [Actinoplanes sp. NPDC051633]|uniref:RNA polymerase sigma factor n=1 Tax=Actinoplanes sp. NPDC051633 TaxID=3155670 RepID=UPI0034303B74